LGIYARKNIFLQLFNPHLQAKNRLFAKAVKEMYYLPHPECRFDTKKSMTGGIFTIFYI
jgi:hypothetical protein